MSLRKEALKNKFASEEIDDSMNNSAAFYELKQISTQQHELEQREYDILIRQLKQKVDFKEPPLEKFNKLVKEGKVD